MLRPAGFPALSIAPQALADKLRPVLPQWAMGLEEPGLARYLALTALGGDADLAACGAGLALWSWQRAPLDRQRAELVAQVLPGAPAGAFAAALLPRLALGPDQDALSPDEMGALLASGDMGLILRILLPRLRDAATGLAWLAPAWDGLLRQGSVDLPLAALEACAWPAELSPLRARLRAEAEFLYAPPDRALAALEGVDARLFGGFAALLRAELLPRLGEAQAGRAQLAALFSALPWHTHLGLKLHDLLAPPPVAAEADTARAAILVYSWNKAALTRQTLESLARTDYGQARILALDNGSSDGTGDVMQACAELFPAGRLRVIRLPVNVGAPAARNWLLAQPEVQEAEFAVFLDDDVLLPQRWLGRLLGEALAHPETGAAGCRIVSATPPPCLQSADYQLFAPSGREGSIRGLAEHVNVFDNCAGALDFGLFSYARPAVHVSGCCHALRTSVLREQGGFDIRFSPTQFDDLDRDLRSAAAGRPAVYAGDVAIAHVQHSSLARAKGAAAMGQVFGNKIKLEGKHQRAAMDAVFRAGLDRLWDDLRAKWALLPA